MCYKCLARKSEEMVVPWADEICVWLLKISPQHQRCRPTCLRWFPSNLHLLYITLWSDPLLLHYNAAFRFPFLPYPNKCWQCVTFWVFVTFFTSCGTLHLICLLSLSVLQFCTRGVFAVFPSPFQHSGFIVRCPLHCIALYYIALHCPPLLVSHLLSSLDWPWGCPSKFFIH